MTYNLNARTGMAAIAAVLALSSTPSFAQETDPAVETSPAETTTTTTTTTSETTTSADPLAPVEAEPVAATTTTTTKTTKAVARSERAAPRANAPSTARATPAVSSPVEAAPAMAAVEAPAAPVVPPVASEELAANPMTPDVATPADGSMMVDMDEALPIAGAAGLALLGLAGAGMVMRRRRRSSSDENMSYSEAHQWHEPSVARAEPATPVATPAPHAPSFASRSAFSWGNAPATATATAMPAARSGSHIDAALRGPTPENPFLSLKKRLRRAAFFDQRERAVAAGTAKPLSPMAGLPKAMAEKASSFVRGDTVTARPGMVTA